MSNSCELAFVAATPATSSVLVNPLVSPSPLLPSKPAQRTARLRMINPNSNNSSEQQPSSRRAFLLQSLQILTASTLMMPNKLLASPSSSRNSLADPESQDFEKMAALQGKDYGKPRMRYKDFNKTPSGLQYKDARSGNGDVVAEAGDRIVLDWEGYTIGYYGRIFEARNRAQGGAFTGEDKDFYRFVVGDRSVIPALDEGVRGLKVGAIRQLIIPPELGYPPSDPSHDKVGPKPKTFSGQRALDFVLGNQGLIDKTLLINIEVKRIDKGFNKTLASKPN